MPLEKVKYPSLNGLRGISILLVLFHHLNLHFSIFTTVSKYVPLIIDGQLGVNVFFVISGFLITTLLLKEEDNTGTISLKNFYTRRTLRIFPAYYFLLLVYFFLYHYHFIFISKASWFTAITYTKYFNWQLDWYTSHAWSLSIEEHFYLFWPLLFLAGKKTRKVFVCIIIILVPLLRGYFTYYPQSWANYLSIFCRLDAIAMGCFFALYKEKILRWYSLYWKSIFYTSILLLFFFLFLQDFNLKHHLHLGFFNIIFGGSFGSITNILIASIMLFSVFGPRGTWFKFLNSKIINQIGLWSYSLYLWQQLFIVKTSYWINQYPINILLTLLVAIISYYLVEKPFLKIKAKFSGSTAKSIIMKN